MKKFRVFVPTKAEIEQELRRLSNLMEASATVGGVADEVCDSISQIECDIHNRAGVESGRIKE